METRIERRISPRVPVQYPIVYFYQGSDAPRLHMIDLSEGGAAIEAYDSLPVGAALSFLIVAGKDQVVEARGKVVHVQSVPDKPYRIGVHLSRLTPDNWRGLLESTRPS